MDPYLKRLVETGRVVKCGDGLLVSHDGPELCYECREPVTDDRPWTRCICGDPVHEACGRDGYCHFCYKGDNEGKVMR